MFNREGEPSNIWPTRNSLRDRIFAAGGHNPSSDPVIQQLREDLDKQRQMFFDRINQPQWETGHRGFPFPEVPRRFGVDRSSFPHGEDGDFWVEDDGPDRRKRWPSTGSGRSSSSSASGDVGSQASSIDQCGGTRSDSPGSGQMDSPRTQKPAARSATGEFPNVASAEDGSRGFRASSAPPLNCGSPRRFTTSVHLPCNGAENQRSAKASENESKASNVRHIPIFVEGRDEPVLPRVVEEENDTQKAAENRKQRSTAIASNAIPVATEATKRSDDPSHVSKKPIPMPFYSFTPSVENEKILEAGSAAIPLPYPNEGPSSKTSSSEVPGTAGNQQPQQIPIPMPYSSATVQEPRDSSKSSNMGDEFKKSKELEQIDNIKKEAETLLPRIESFHGNRDDREFLYLDEMLTRLLLRLDNVFVEGREDVRQTRKEAITSIQKCISLLESKLCIVHDSVLVPTKTTDLVKESENVDEVEDSSHIIASVAIPIKSGTNE